ncbi:WD40-repeat-containing domain protein [Lineolata rhizophorae]|uniref:WD40-repeat-containing domain protein n=1 Tax=Lineolata rhizophorae TaxID=578093 RepID=A0A6A6NKY7_9PEZI|nr:WD40-repeat-containing domain protein [Lineolata rhizophorae]
MAPRGRSLPKAAFAPVFAKQKTTTYSDLPPQRVTSAHALRSVAWNPLGTLIATGAGDRTLRIWNPEKSQVKNSTELRGHSSAVERVAWNPEKEAELASCGSDGVVRLWDVRSKGSVGEVKVAGEGFTLAWRPDGSELLVGTKDDTLIPISRSTLTPLASHRQPVQTNQTMFSHSGNELFLTTGEGHVKILDYPSMEVLHTLNAHTSSCLSLDFSPTAAYLAIGGSDALITLWDSYDWVCGRSLGGMLGSVRSVSFSFDGSYIVGGSDEGASLEIAHVETAEYVHHVETDAAAPCVAWHPSKYVLAYSGDVQGLKIIGSIGGN